ncbi:TPA: tRNA(Ile)-lysidine synthetase, partial [Candidatus Poribacteria bacterium]|nr:tRNA(Ile)-lysidine synthetase [Candidatus Poribacteria bacterium]
MRNRIRIDLIPHLKENYNPNIQEALNRAAEILQVESDFMDTIATTAFD